jgi:signal transduction histidine kinase
MARETTPGTGEVLTSAAGPDDRSPETPVPGGAPRRAERERWLRRLRLQRQLHDGASLRISALALQLGVFRSRVPDGETDLRASVDELQDQLHAVLQELRQVAREIYPPLLDQAGLQAALCEAADGIDVPVVITAPVGRLDPAVEGAAYFAVTDCLRALEPGGPPAGVTLRAGRDVLDVVVDGVPVRLASVMGDQVRGLGGEVTTEGGPGTGSITVSIPCG